MSALEIGKYYDFSLPINSVIGTSFSNAQLLSILTYDIAIKFGNVDSLQRQMAPSLPPGTPSNYKKYDYYLFSVRGTQFIIADTWITTGSIVETNIETRTITLNNVSSGTISIIRDQLNLLGISYTID